MGREGVLASGPAKDAMTEVNLSQLYGIGIKRQPSASGHLHFY